MVTEVKRSRDKRSNVYFGAIMCQNLLLNGWANFLQTWWEGAPGWELVSRRPPRTKGQRSEVKVQIK